MIVKAEPVEQCVGGRRVGTMFRAMSHRNFRLFWAGAFVSNSGTWMQTVAQGWLVLKLTDSPFWLGFDGFVATFPGLLLTLVGGVYADQVDRNRLLIYTHVGAGLSALVLGALLLVGVVADDSDVWIVLVLSFITGCCMAVAGPSYLTITFDLVGREDLANAIALNSTQFQISRIIGPLFAGVTIKAFGLAGCFIANGLSYVAIVAALSSMRREGRAQVASKSSLPPAVQARGYGALWQNLLEGFGHIGERPRMRLLMLSSAVMCLFGAPYLVMLPLFARDIFGWGEMGLSLMMGTAGAGALCGALLLAYLGDFRGKGLFVVASALAAALSLIGLSLAVRPAVALLMLFGVGFWMVCFFALGNLLLQQLVSDQMRGRVMSIWMLTFSTTPVGTFMFGLIAEQFGAPWTLAAGGIFVFAIIAFVALRPRSIKSLRNT